jgi:serine/threonine protein kinase
MIDHPNIVPLIDIYYTVNNCYIIMEYCEGGSLQSLVDTKISIDWPRAAYQIGAACQYLASHRVIHRDIKPANVLVRGGTFKLADFGFAYELSFIDEIIE